MKVYMVNYPNHAGHWIYKGFDAAWRKLGYDVVLPTERGTEHAFTMPMPASSKYPGEDYIIMTVDALVNEQSLEAISKSHKTFVFAQPNTFPLPWGAHPNFQCGCPDNIIESLNKMDIYGHLGRLILNFIISGKKYILYHWHLILYLMFRLKKRNIQNMIFAILVVGPIMDSMKKEKL